MTPLGSHAAVLKGVTSGGFLPTDIADLELWLDAADSGTVTLNGDDVSQWDDKSADGNDAVQGSASLQPLYDIAAVNGLNAISFDGANSLDGGAVPDILSEPETLFIVYSREGSTGNMRAFHGNNNWLVGPYNNKYQSFNGGFIEGSDAVNGQLVVASLVIDSGGAELWEDGVSQGTVANTTDHGAGYDIGSSAGGSEFLTGFVCEVIMYSAALSDEDRVTVQDYLQRWVA